MNKKVVPFLLAVILLGGCQAAVSREEVRQLALRQEKRIGILQSLGGAVMSNEATHLLRNEDGTVLYLKSKTVDLSGDKFAGKQVEVMGEIVRTTDGNQTMQVESIDLIESESALSSDALEWLEFENKQLGLSFRYRNDYEITEGKDQVVLKLKKPVIEGGSELDASTTVSSANEAMATFVFELLSVDDNFDLARSMGVSSLKDADVLAGGYHKSKITQRAVDAYKKASAAGREIAYFLKNDSGSYRLAFKAGKDQEDFMTEQNMFYDVLASVDFLAQGAVSSDLKADEDAVDVEVDSLVEPVADDVVADEDVVISGFSTFTSDSQKFSVQYPKSYYFGNVSKRDGAVLSYQFGEKPLEEVAGEINLDIVKEIPVTAKTVEYAGKKLSMVKEGGQVFYYLRDGNRFFRVSAPLSRDFIAKQMAGSVKVF